MISMMMLMKRIKKSTCMMCAMLIAAVLFAGCAAEGAGGTTTAGQSGTTPAGQSGAAPQAVGPDDNSSSGPDAAHSLHPCTPEIPAGFYSIELLNDRYANIAFVDYAQKRQIFLCPRPECTHDTEACPSVLPLDEALAVPVIFSEMDQLFFLQTGASQTAPPHLERAGLDGQDRKTIVEFPGNFTLWPHLYADGGSLYLTATEFDAEYGAIGDSILQIDLTTGGYKVLYTYPQAMDALTIEGGFGRELVLASYQIDPDEQLLLNYDFFNVDTCSFDPEKKMTLHPADTGSFWEGERYYEICYENEEIREVDYLTQETHVYSYAEIIHPSGAPERGRYVAVFAEDRDLIRIEAPPSERDSPEEYIFYEFLLDTETQEIRAFDLMKEYKDDPITVLAKDEREDLFLVYRDWKEVQTIGENGVPVRTWSPQLAFIQKDDYAKSIERYIPVVSEVYPDDLTRVRFFP